MEDIRVGQVKSPKPKRAGKDTVFTSLFRDRQYLFQLYQALHPEDTDVKESGLTVITLENIMAGGIYNDLGFLLDDKLIFLVEAQSTWTMNIIIRAFMYLSKSYQDYILRTNQNVYGSKKVKLPKPEVYVIYTGNRQTQPESISFAEEDQVRKYGLADQAVREAIRICKDRNILKEYLQGRESEVVDIMLTLFSQEEVWDMSIRSAKKKLQ